MTHLKKHKLREYIFLQNRHEDLLWRKVFPNWLTLSTGTALVLMFAIRSMSISLMSGTEHTVLYFSVHKNIVLSHRHNYKKSGANRLRARFLFRFSDNRWYLSRLNMRNNTCTNKCLSNIELNCFIVIISMLYTYIVMSLLIHIWFHMIS